MLRIHPLRSDQWTTSLHRTSGGIVWTNTKDASPTSMEVPTQSLSLDFKGAGLVIFSGSSPVAPMIPKSPREPPLAAERDTRTASEPVAEVTAAEPEADIAEEVLPELPFPEPLATEGAHQIHLIIDSLPQHQLIETIPVTVEALGDKVFTATISALNLTGTGNTLGEALLIVKEQVDLLYDQLVKLPQLNDDEKGYLKFLRSHIDGSLSSDGNRARNDSPISPAISTKSKKFSWRDR